ncbi:MAG: polysaccharide deacetylase family protein [Armatimonadetes bacterium]|nr:polysaccharide deacetylase family protein [Armatimonadota bacterium]
MKRHRALAGGRWAALLVVPLLLAAGCRQQQASETQRTPAGAAEVATPAATAAPAAPVSDTPPNELGRVPVLEYHKFAASEGRWTRTPENFRKDLEWLYQNGFRAVSMQDYVTGNINLPRGASPVVFTFDDADEGQFRYLERNGQLVIDPDCALGILEEFNREHPDFGLKATFYVLPYGFGQGKHTKRKFQYIASKGMELGNHSVSHANLKKLSDAKVQEELAGAQKVVQEAVPGYEFFSLALPLGIAPREKPLAVKGSSNGMSYHHRAVLLVGSVPARSPYDKEFNPARIERVQATDVAEVPEYLRLRAQLKKLVAEPGRRYVSDGDPKTITVPAARKEEVSPERAGGRRIQTR